MYSFNFLHDSCKNAGKDNGPMDDENVYALTSGTADNGREQKS